MKSFSISKIFPLLFVLFLILILGFNNQNQKTKLKILIWETPTLSLSKYLAISVASGFLVSYFITNYIASSKNPKLNRILKYETEKIIEEKNETDNINKSMNYDNTLFERDLKDPSPTINANFRVIGRINNQKQGFYNNESTNINPISNDLDNDYYDDQNVSEDYPDREPTIDWDDYSFANW